MDALTGLPARRLAGLLRAREVSASEVVAAHLARLSQVNPSLDAIVQVVAAHLARLSQVNPSLDAIVQVAADVEDRARELDAALAGGAAVGPLHGVPFTAKDNLASRGVVTAIGVHGRLRRDPVFDLPAPRRTAAPRLPPTSVG
jgi:Asp-tRNA(Asn)/Glu-tRNA(Gln) amidotransferase A subunit family amidase